MNSLEVNFAYIDSLILVFRENAYLRCAYDKYKVHLGAYIESVILRE